jgi:hypothetical protein
MEETCRHQELVTLQAGSSKRKGVMGRHLRTGVLLACSALLLVFQVHDAKGQVGGFKFWAQEGSPLDSAHIRSALAAGRSRDIHDDLCNGTGSGCPNGCPLPVQDLVFLMHEGGAVRADVVVSLELWPGAKCRVIATQNDTCMVNGVVWVLYEADICE